MKTISTFVFLLTLTTVFGQSEETLQKIENARIALITERLDLTSEQAEKFWPIYNEYANRQKEVRQDFSLARQNFDPNTASEEENKRLLELGLKVKENQLNLEREYSERLLTVISNRQIMSLRKAEDDFRQMLIDRMRERNVQKQRIQQERQQNNARMNQRNRN